MATVTTGHEHLNNYICGAWKFHFTDLGFAKAGQFALTHDEIIETARAMVDEMHTLVYTFTRVDIYGTAKDEIGIHFCVRINLSLKEQENHFIAYFENLFMRRHGKGYKGYSIGINPISIQLEEK